MLLDLVSTARQSLIPPTVYDMGLPDIILETTIATSGIKMNNRNNSHMMGVSENTALSSCLKPWNCIFGQLLRE